MNTVSDFVFDKRKAYSVLWVSTLVYFVIYLVWVMFSVIGVPIKKTLNLNGTEFALLISMPVLIGSCLRIPFGVLVDRFGGRVVMFVALLFTAIPIWLISCATLYWEFLVLDLFTGVLGGLYSVGIPYVTHWFPKNRQGLAMNVYGAGSLGATLNSIIAPLLIVAFGWTIVPQIYAYIVVIVALIFWVFSYQDEAHIVSKSVPFIEQIKAFKEPDVLRLCFYYAIAFGGFMALSLWMAQYYMNEFDLTLKHAALLVVCFTLPSSILRILGGWVADKYGGRIITTWMLRISCICLLLLLYFSMMKLNFYIFTIAMFIQGTIWAFGKASIFKCISEDYIKRIGVVSGIISAVGGVFGLIWVIFFGILLDLTGVYSSAFMLLLLVNCLALILENATPKNNPATVPPSAH